MTEISDNISRHRQCYEGEKRGGVGLFGGVGGGGGGGVGGGNELIITSFNYWGKRKK